MNSLKKLTKKQLFLPIFSMILVMLINVIYDIACGQAPLSFFTITIKNGVLPACSRRRVGIPSAHCFLPV